MCPACNGQRLELLGTLGSLSWWRCRDCGTESYES